MTHWQPTASLDTLKFRATILSNIREFFAQRNILEVETPCLSAATVTEPTIQSLRVPRANQNWYLQTSPEYAMKRLLAAGSGAIYQICKAFREDESGRLHNPEFTILEWYRPGFAQRQFMDEMDEFLRFVIESRPAERLSYADVFKKYLDINPHTASLESLQNLAQRRGLQVIGENFQQDNWLQILMTEIIEPNLGKDCPTFIYDYPITQAALAKIRLDTIPVAERFEVYINGIELANGFHELTDAEEQRRRFEENSRERTRLKQPIIPIDENFLAALNHGLPACSGVAFGVDRLVMVAANKVYLSDVLCFPIDRA